MTFGLEINWLLFFGVFYPKQPSQVPAPFLFYLFIYFFPLTALIGCGAIELFLAQLWVWGSLQAPQGDGSCNDF